MPKRRNSIRFFGFLALAIIMVKPAVAFEWPWARQSTCDHCGQSVRIMSRSGHTCAVHPVIPAPIPYSQVPHTAPGPYGGFAPGMGVQPGEPVPYAPSEQPSQAPGTSPYSTDPNSNAPRMEGAGNDPGRSSTALTPNQANPNAADAFNPMNTNTASAPDAGAGAGAGGDASNPAGSSGVGGGLSESEGALNMFGDVSPISRFAVLEPGTGRFTPPAPPEPPNRPGRFPSERMKSPALVPSVRNFKVADNQTPMPVDRITYSFNFFDDVNGAINKRFNVPLSQMQAYRHVFGFEKTFFDKNASFGMRLPLNTLTADSPIRNLGQTSTSLGDLTAYFKYALYMDRAKGRVISTGMAITMPTGPTTFGGANYLRGLHYTTLQPFIAGLWTSGNLYAINFTSIDVPTSSRDVTIIYQDISLGYFIYRNANPNGLIRSIAPTFETHVNIALNHNNPFDRTDLAATSQVVNLTQGLNVFLKNNSVLSVGMTEPVTGPRPFNVEALLMFNKFF